MFDALTALIVIYGLACNCQAKISLCQCHSTEKDNNDLIIPKQVKYNIDKITKTGFILKGDMMWEIERTLSMCEEFVDEIN